MTIPDLQAIADRESLRQAAITYEAAKRGGVYDWILGKRIEWNVDGIDILDSSKGSKRCSSQ